MTPTEFSKLTPTEARAWLDHLKEVASPTPLWKIHQIAGCYEPEETPDFDEDAADEKRWEAKC